MEAENSENLFSVSVVVPIYNSEDTIAKLYADLTNTLKRHTSAFELIFVNDGSRDSSWQHLEHLVKAESNVELRIINLMRNYGQHNALLCGIRRAKNEVIVTLDDDLQHPAEEIPKLLSRLSQGFDVVYGVPLQMEHSIFRSFCSRFTKFILKQSLGANTARDISPFRAFRKILTSSFEHYSSPQTNLDVLLTWGTTKFDAVLTRHVPRTSGRSNYSLGKLITHAINMMTGFSVLPLRAASFIGLSGVVLGLLLLTYVIGRYMLQGSPVPGFPFLASIIILFSGAQLLGLGIIGEYLARMYIRTMNQPVYTIRNEISSSNN